MGHGICEGMEPEIAMMEGFREETVVGEWRGCLIDVDGQGIRNWGIRNSTLKQFGIGSVVRDMTKFLIARSMRAVR